MKKLLFATAMVASAAAFADPINAISFESYTPGATFTNGAVENNEPGTGKFFYFEGDATNSSMVTNETPSAKRTDYFKDAVNTNNYLALDTEGGTFWRSIGNISFENDVYGLGDPRPVASTGTYLDTLVQFTVTEDDEPTVGSDDKLAIWLGIDTNGVETTTNLMVKAKSWALEGGVPTGVATSFMVTNVVVDPGTWYRLTVKAVQTVIDPNSGAIMPAFQIYIDGTEVAATTPQISTEMQDLFSNGVWLEGMAALASANKLFPTLAEDPAAVADVTLQGVGFQGTGAVDEIVWTEDDPFPAATVEFTLTYAAGDANVTLGAVTYTIGEDPAETVTFTNGEAPIPEGATVTIAAPTFAEGYQLAALTTNTVAVASPSFPFTFTMDAAMTVAITAEQIPAVEDWVDNPTMEITAGDTAATAYPGLAGSALATADAQKLTIWAKAKNIAYNDIKNDTTGTYTEAYLLNCAVADVEDEKAAFKANITVAADGTPTVTATTTNTDGDAYNGTLKLKGKVNLTDATWTEVNAASTTYHFYMYELSL